MTAPRTHMVSRRDEDEQSDRSAPVKPVIHAESRTRPASLGEHTHTKWTTVDKNCKRRWKAKGRFPRRKIRFLSPCGSVPVGNTTAKAGRFQVSESRSHHPLSRCPEQADCHVDCSMGDRMQVGLVQACDKGGWARPGRVGCRRLHRPTWPRSKDVSKRPLQGEALSDMAAFCSRLCPHCQQT